MTTAPTPQPKEDRLIAAMDRSNQLMAEQMRAIVESNVRMFQQMVGLLAQPQQPQQFQHYPYHAPQWQSHSTDSAASTPPQSQSWQGSSPHPQTWQSSSAGSSPQPSSNLQPAASRSSSQSRQTSFVEQMESANMPTTNTPGESRPPQHYDVMGINWN